MAPGHFSKCKRQIGDVAKAERPETQVFRNLPSIWCSANQPNHNGTQTIARLSEEARAPGRLH
jgi:hypothetical protein